MQTSAEHKYPNRTTEFGNEHKCFHCINCERNKAKEMLDPVMGKEARSFTRCTRLHELCMQSSDLEQIMSFVVKHPMSTRCVDRFGRSALFWTIRLGRSDDIIKALYKTSPPDAMISSDVYGKTCLDLLYSPRHRNTALLRWILDHDPSLAVSRSPSATSMPLVDRFCIRWSLSSSSRRHEEDLNMEILSLTIQAAHLYSCCQCQNSDRSSIPLLHMAMDLRLPCIVLQKLAVIFPEHVNARKTLSSALTCAPLHYFVTHYPAHEDKLAASFLMQLIHTNPKAAQEPFRSSSTGNSHWALHAAIRSGYATTRGSSTQNCLEAIDSLVMAAPWVLHKIEESHLLPFQLAASMGESSTCSQTKDSEHLDAIYHLLRYQPSVLREQ